MKNKIISNLKPCSPYLLLGALLFYPLVVFHLNNPIMWGDLVIFENLDYLWLIIFVYIIYLVCLSISFVLLYKNIIIKKRILNNLFSKIVILILLSILSFYQSLIIASFVFMLYIIAFFLWHLFLDVRQTLS